MRKLFTRVYVVCADDDDAYDDVYADIEEDVAA